MPEGMTAVVVTTQPNRYREAIAEAPECEQIGRVTVHRIALPAHDSGMIDQARSFLTFAGKALPIVFRSGPFDGAFATSSRLMTATLGAFVSTAKSVPLYLDIRDLFAETMSNVLGRGTAKVLAPLFNLLERWTFRRASYINVVSPGFTEHVHRIAPAAELSELPNGIDEEFLAIDPAGSLPATKRPPTILYAGNVGEGQGLHRILPEAARSLGSRAQFRIVGHGGGLAELKKSVSGLPNVTLVPPVSRTVLLQEYAQADILFVHLNDYPAFLKVLPSKIFEYGAMGKPILAGLNGVSAKLVQEELPYARVFEPCRPDQLVEAFDQLGPVDLAAVRTFREKFARTEIMNRMADDLVSFVAQG
ncbi:glycosyltransferase [Erythrobacter jejuensis]|uniref:Glycosyltransferase n=2 Tax=Parerythrobacter jejuensis TaxID=795812 RepID=A0A845AMN3_9SPHN|nr:glycosyltransferase [Parerythrobacter jejuensis]MXP33634.1 glycosyltransferase [Parerythrobacter jejuensis]